MKYLPLLLLLLSANLNEDGYYFQDFVQRVETHFLLPKGIIKAVSIVESRANPNRVTKLDGKGGRTSYGLMQIQEPSARQVGFEGKAKDLLIPETNVYFGARYLAWLISKTKGDIPSALNCYNSGWNSPLCKEKRNRNYSDKVLDSYMRNRL